MKDEIEIRKELLEYCMQRKEILRQIHECDYSENSEDTLITARYYFNTKISVLEWVLS